MGIRAGRTLFEANGSHVFVYAATKNRGKLAELRAIFSEAGWTIEESALYIDVVEGDVSYTDNAALKARTLHAALVKAGRPAAVIGDDSGLEVAALDGRPGVLSARYGGASATWAQRRRTLLEEVDGSGSIDRAARFVCALHHIDARGLESAVIDSFPGRLATHERGGGGFSYDAVFIPDDRSETFAQISEAEKNTISHRARAARRLLEAIRSREPVAMGRSSDFEEAGPAAM